MIVDWFDAGRGDPARRHRPVVAADRSRRRRSGRASSPRRRRPASCAGGSIGAYLDARGDLDPTRLARWRAVVAVARVAEGVASAGLDGLWHAWARPERRRDAADHSVLDEPAQLVEDRGRGGDRQATFSGHGSSTTAPASAAMSAPAA